MKKCKWSFTNFWKQIPGNLKKDVKYMCLCPILNKRQSLSQTKLSAQDQNPSENRFEREKRSDNKKPQIQVFALMPRARNSNAYFSASKMINQGHGNWNIKQEQFRALKLFAKKVFFAIGMSKLLHFSSKTWNNLSRKSGALSCLSVPWK